MKKQDFTIEGTKALKEAFIKESNLQDSAINYKNYLTSSSIKKNALTTLGIKKDIHFMLPQDWNEALEYVKEYFKEEPEFKVGDYIAVLSLCDNEFIMVRKFTGYKPNKDAPFEYETGQCSTARLATQKEILAHLQEEFTEKTGIDVGSRVEEENNKGVISKGEVKNFFLHIRGKVSGSYSDFTAIWFNNNPNEKYQLGIRLKCAGVMSPNCYLAKPKLTFGGKEVTIEKVSSGVRITCNGVTGTLSQMEKIYNAFFLHVSTYKFGSVTLKTVEYDDGGEWTNEISNTPSQLTIGCTTGTAEEFTNILKEAKKLN